MNWSNNLLPVQWTFPVQMTDLHKPIFLWEMSCRRDKDQWMATIQKTRKIWSRFDCFQSQLRYASRSFCTGDTRCVLPRSSSSFVLDFYRPDENVWIFDSSGIVNDSADSWRTVADVDYFPVGASISIIKSKKRNQRKNYPRITSIASERKFFSIRKREDFNSMFTRCARWQNLFLKNFFDLKVKKKWQVDPIRYLWLKKSVCDVTNDDAVNHLFRPSIACVNEETRCDIFFCFSSRNRSFLFTDVLKGRKDSSSPFNESLENTSIHISQHFRTMFDEFSKDFFNLVGWFTVENRGEEIDHRRSFLRWRWKIVGSFAANVLRKSSGFHIDSIGAKAIRW